MNTPIIDPSTLSEEQREAIRKLYADYINSNESIMKREKAKLIKNSVVACRLAFACGKNQGAMAAMTKLFGSEFFKKEFFKKENDMAFVVVEPVELNDNESERMQMLRVRQPGRGILAVY